MIVLGINFGHDASCAVIRDGKIIFAMEEEKASRVKQDFGWPRLAIEEFFRQTNLAPGDIDIVSFGGCFYTEIARNEIKYRFTKRKWYKNIEIIDRLAAYAGIQKKQISKKNIQVFEKEIRLMGFSRATIEFHNHHLSHAASAFYCAPFDADLVVTSDGHGEGESFNFYRPDEKSGLVCIVSNSHETSIGQFYSAVTKLLGFRPTRHEGKITGLAAYGKPSPLLTAFEQVFYWENDALKRFPMGKLEDLWKHYEIGSKISLKHKINMKTSESDFGYLYAVNSLILDCWLRDTTKGYSKEDIAYACQHVSEEVTIEEIRRVYKKYYNNTKINIVLAGGVFANVRINQKILELDFVDNIFIQPAMGDSGLALGAAILSDRIHDNSSQYRFSNTYFGPNYRQEVEALINSLGGNGLTVRKMKNPAKEVAEMLVDNQIVGFWDGAMEWGPRALGSRSIILNTFDKTVNDSLNQRLNRTEFMPFAPSVVDYKAKEYFPMYDSSVPAADYMTITYDTAPEHHEMLQAVVHIDGTARPQIVRRELNPYYFDVIDEFCKITGCGAIVNTSFNAHEEPIVNTPKVALSALLSKRIDVLVLNDYLIRYS